MRVTPMAKGGWRGEGNERAARQFAGEQKRKEEERRTEEAEQEDEPTGGCPQGERRVSARRRSRLRRAIRRAGDGRTERPLFAWTENVGATAKMETGSSTTRLVVPLKWRGLYRTRLKHLFDSIVDALVDGSEQLGP